MTTESIHITRTTIALRPDQSRVLLRPFDPGDAQRTRGLSRGFFRCRKTDVSPLLDEVLAEFSTGMRNRRDFPRTIRAGPQSAVTGRQSVRIEKLLIGSYFVCRVFARIRGAIQSVDCPAPGPVGRAGRRAAVYPEPARHRGRPPLLHHVSHRQIHPDGRIEVWTAAAISANRARSRTRCTRRLSSSGSCTNSG